MVGTNTESKEKFFFAKEIRSSLPKVSKFAPKKYYEINFCGQSYKTIRICEVRIPQ
jgi:hypothetical protein